MSQVPAGWFPDPYGRFQQRWWDGADWTASVSTDGTPTIDPMGNSPVIPFATPPTAIPGGHSGGSVRLLDTMGPPARERQRPSLRRAVAGLGGAVVAAGVLLLAAGESTNRTAITIVGAALVALAWALRRFVTVDEIAAASVGMVVVGVAAFAVGLTVSDGNGGFLTGLLAALLLLALWVAPGFRGQNLLLALGLSTLLAAFGSLSGGLDASENPDSLVPSGLTDNIGRQGVIYLVGAALLLGGTWWLDRRGYRGAGTALCAAGLAAAVTGVVLLVDNFGDISGPLFVLAVGLAVCVVGSHGGRRATTWAGAALVAAGMVALIVGIVKPDSAQAGGITALVAGVLLVALPLLAAPLRRRAGQAVSDGSGARP